MGNKSLPTAKLVCPWATEVGSAMGTINGLHLPIARQFPADFGILMEIQQWLLKPDETTKLICHHDVGPLRDKNQ
eukprot:3319549-Ditylum_brightwellii.AAC.1